MNVRPREKLLGITVLPEYVQNEGVEGVLDRLAHTARANAVTTSPYVMEPADEQTGGREPPIDAGAGKVRLLDRPLWGKRELFVRTAPSFVPDRTLYAGLPYHPAEPTELTRRAGGQVAEFIQAAQARHLMVCLQVQAAIPPGYRVQFGGPRDEDKPRLPDGRVPADRVANNGSLASPAIRAYTQALLRDLVRAYPAIDGIRIDWPEYPPYSWDDIFVDFSPHAEAAATRLGFNFQRMKQDVAALKQSLEGSVTNDRLRRWLEPDGGRQPLLDEFRARPGVVDWLAFKATLAAELVTECRATLDDAGSRRMALLPNAFAPPWTLASGADFARFAPHAQGALVKLYTMHWPMMLRGYGQTLMQRNIGLDEALVVRCLERWLDIADDQGRESLDDYAYPEPDAPHPCGLAAQARKIRDAQAAAGDMPIYALAHGYGPVDDFRRRFTAAWQAAPAGVWINRYGYLSDEKLRAIGEVVATT